MRAIEALTALSNSASPSSSSRQLSSSLDRNSAARPRVTAGITGWDASQRDIARALMGHQVVPTSRARAATADSRPGRIVPRVDTGMDETSNILRDLEAMLQALVTSRNILLELIH